ncbi:hypothetical protein VTN49DRAFT_3516 [Thermomyces lanuginosus]|uniref:uncharacterized protein n=1 Tax=Thermomyces lanuginosus TaxID=5541 RepID=UPI003743E6A1
MALVSYSDSEGSDVEDQQVEIVERASTPPREEFSFARKPTKSTATNAPSLVDRGNPRKIRVALPEIKQETEDGEEEGPARKKPKMNGGGSLFSAFNSMLPAPKRTANAQPVASSGKTFSLKTGAAPGFQRDTNGPEVRDEQQSTVPSENLRPPLKAADTVQGEKLLNEENYEKKGNAMMFKPLSVARNPQKKKKSAAMVVPKARSATDGTAEKSAASQSAPAVETKDAPAPAPAPAPAKQKVSLFSYSSADAETSSPALGPEPEPSARPYQSLLYKRDEDESVDNDAQHEQEIIESETAEAFSSAQPAVSTAASSSASQPTLDAVASDLNLSRSERRQLFGRNADAANARILTFETDAMYEANKEFIANAAEAEAAQKARPVRAIAPGKHSLRQLVQAATSQKEALEESFAAGKRNKKEAGSRYGW